MTRRPSRAKPVAHIVTCEHASTRVPRGFEDLDLSPTQVGGHEGYDLGADGCARRLAAALGVRPVLGVVTRLAIDLNRSRSNPRIFSAASRQLDPARRTALRALHRRHWDRVFDGVARLVARRHAVVHIAVHSFSPVLAGEERTMDVGLLYDPTRCRERRLAARWKQDLEASSALRVRRNAPYRGVSDGLPRRIREAFPDAAYAGIELELNQRLLVRGRFPGSLVALLVGTLPGPP